MLGTLTKENFNQLLSRFTTAELENILAKSRYFQQAHVLLAKKYQQENNPKFDEQLQLAVLYSQDRKLLYSIFNETQATFFDENLVSASRSEPVIEILPETEPMIDQEEEIAIPTTSEVSHESIVEETESAAPTLPLLNEIQVEKTAESEPETVFVEQKVSAAEEASFNTAESHTFDEWLNAFKTPANIHVEVIPQEELLPQPEEQDKVLEELIVANLPVQELIEEETQYSKGLDTFIEEQKQKHKPQETKHASSENELVPELITETMAKIYEMQKKYSKAIQAYEVLSLKYPEKSDLFAARINYIKSVI